MIKVLGIAASPRRRGNSELLLDKFLEGARSEGAGARKIVLNQLRYKPSQEREPKDDMRLICRLFDESDIIAISSPIYFGCVTAQLKAMIDRIQPLWEKKEILKESPLSPKPRKGVFLCVSGKNDRDFFIHARKEIRILFSVLEIKYAAELYCGGVDSKGAILRKRESALRRSHALGAQIVHKIAHQKAGC